jgi:hypothetical protein
VYATYAAVLLIQTRLPISRTFHNH